MLRLLKWKMAWATFLQGLVGILSLGYFNPQWSLTVAKQIARWRYSNE